MNKEEFEEIFFRGVLGGRIASLREEQGFSQRELAKFCNMPQSTITRIENGEVSPSLSTLNRIARALSKTVEIGFK
ncbi:MAG: helix-turn-helix transcriptional regulator [Streptococcaceae bacterium]|jgi:transcriptional regulator with XRE-family HTH domain|nr:helix-turn-helix transcriptional regulator [Streptococcaceae bacterium]